MKEVVCMFFVGVLLSLNLYGDSVSVNKEKSGFVWSDATEESLSESEYNRVILGYMKEKYPEETRKKIEAEVKEKTIFLDNLMWQDNKATKKITSDWYKAQEYCKNLSFGAFINWRLPTKNELVELYMQKDKLNNIANTRYWSSKYLSINNPNFRSLKRGLM